MHLVAKLNANKVCFSLFLFYQINLRINNNSIE
nr:MAG TPA: hypothetical protein [Caudoviricetes sp.]